MSEGLSNVQLRLIEAAKRWYALSEACGNRVQQNNASVQVEGRLADAEEMLLQRTAELALRALRAWTSEVITSEVNVDATSVGVDGT